MRLVCFGDSFTATADLEPGAVAAGCPPSWIDLLAEHWDCSAVTQGVNGTGPLELLYQIQNFGEFLPGDRVFCAFSRITRFCLTPSTPTIHHFAELPHGEYHLHFNAKSSARDAAVAELTAPEMSRIIQAHRWYDLFLNNGYREQILQYAVFTALDGIAAANPQSQFYVKYCFSREWELHQIMGLNSKFFKLLEGDMYSICGEEPGLPVTNHFTVERVGDFVNYLDEVMV